MANLNKKTNQNVLRIYEGGIAKRITPYEELRRSVLANLLWEDTFYEDGESIADRIVSLVEKVANFAVANLTLEARNKFNLRHVPLLLIRELTRNHYPTSELIYNVIKNIL